MFYNNVVNKLTDVNTSSKTYWKFIKLVCGCKQHSLIPDLEHFGNTISDSSEKATLSNNYFVEQCQTDFGGDNSLPDFTFITESRLRSLSINSSDFLKILKSLNTCEKSTEIGRMLQHGLVNQIRGRPQSIFNFKMPK